jgi:hypothetical protein
VKFTVSVFQYRDDFARGRIEIEIVNSSKKAVSITDATFTSTYFTHPVSLTGLPYTVPAGGTTDFAETAPKGACGAAKPMSTMSISYETMNGATTDGASHTVTPTPTLPFSSIASLNAQDCGQQAFERVATITPASALRFEKHDGKQIAVLDLTFAPTGKSGTATLTSIVGTSLLIQTEGEVRTFNESFSAASPPTTIPLHFTPSRCGTHVLAEDKIGTLIPIHASAGAYPKAFFRIPVSTAVKGEFYDWVTRYCGE